MELIAQSLINLNWNDCNTSFWVMGITRTWSKPKVKDPYPILHIMKINLSSAVSRSCAMISSSGILRPRKELTSTSNSNLPKMNYSLMINFQKIRYSAPSRGANRHIDLTDRLYIGGIQVPTSHIDAYANVSLIVWLYMGGIQLPTHPLVILML